MIYNKPQNILEEGSHNGDPLGPRPYMQPWATKKDPRRQLPLLALVCALKQHTIKKHGRPVEMEDPASIADPQHKQQEHWD